MKRKMTLSLLTLSLLAGWLCWQPMRPVAANGNTGTGAQVGEPSRVPAITAGIAHNLALINDVTVVAWGSNGNGQTNVPANLSGVTAIAGGSNHSLALKSDGTVVAWGDNTFGKTTVPAGLNGVTAIAAGHSHNLALKSDGTVVAWGVNFNGETDVPANLSGVMALAAGLSHSLALKSDGTVVAWGTNGNGETNVPAGLNGVTALAAGWSFSLALKNDGTVVAWGRNDFDQTNVPAGLNGVTAIAAGAFHSLALKSDGTVVAWGADFDGRITVPAGLNGVTAVAAGQHYSLALKSDGTVVAWGRNDNGVTNVPAGLSGVTAIAMGAFHCLALKMVTNTAPTISGATLTRTAGSPASNAQIATVNDTEDAKNTLSVTATPLTGSGVTVSGISVDAAGNVTATVSAGCSATTSTFTLQVTDSGTLSATATLTVTVNPDATPPDTSLLSTPPGITDGNATFSFTGLDNCSSTVTFECKLDAAGWSACTNPQMYTNLAGGSHTFQVRAKDTLGNVDATPASYTWTVFTSSCSTVVNPVLLPTATRGTPFVQTLSASPTGSYVFSLASGTLPPGVNLANTLGIYSLRGTPNTAGQYTFTIKAKKNNATCEGARTYTLVVP